MSKFKFDPSKATEVYTPKSKSKFANAPVIKEDSSILKDAMETAEDFGEGFLEGVIPLKPQVSAVATAAASLPSTLQEFLDKYREAEKINQERYEQLMTDNMAAKAGEAAGMLVDPFVSGVSKAAVGLGGKLLKPLMAASKEERAVEMALKTGDAKKVASALEQLRIKETTPSLIKTLRQEIPTGALMGGIYGASRSKGVFGGEGEQGLSDDIIENALAGGISGGILGVAGHGFSKYFGKGSKKADIARAVAGKELESGERLGQPIDLEEGALAGKTFASPEGPQLILRDIDEKAKELTERAVGALQKRKDEFNKIFEQYGNSTVNNLASIANPKLERKITEAQGRAVLNEEQKLGRSLTNKEIKMIHDKQAFKIVAPILRKAYPELTQVVEKVRSSKPISDMFRSIDKHFIPDLLTGQPVSFSQLYNIQKRLKINSKKMADAFKLSEIERDMLFGRGNFSGTGILYNEAIGGKKSSGLLERSLEKIVPDVEKYRKVIRDMGAGPVEAILNKNPNLAAQPIKAWNFTDEKIRNILQKQFAATIEKAGGTNRAAAEAAEDLNDMYNLLLKAEAEGAAPQQLQKIAEDVLDLKEKISKSSQNMAALVGVAGQNQALGHMSVEDVTQAFEPVKFLKGLTSLTVGRAVGKGQKTIKGMGGPVVKLRDATIDQLKEYANILSRDSAPWKANLGKAAMQGLEENPMYKGVFLNQVAQNPELRQQIFDLMPEIDMEEKEKIMFNPARARVIGK